MFMYASSALQSTSALQQLKGTDTSAQPLHDRPHSTRMTAQGNCQGPITPSCGVTQHRLSLLLTWLIRLRQPPQAHQVRQQHELSVVGHPSLSSNQTGYMLWLACCYEQSSAALNRAVLL